jgi:hypothetical protein
MFRSLFRGFTLLPILALIALAFPARAQFVIQSGTAYTITLPDLIDNGGGGGTAHISGLTGQTGMVYLTRITGSSGAITKAASTNNISEVDSVNAPGQYTLTLTSTELGALGTIRGYYKSANSDPLSFSIRVVAFNPDDANALGLANVSAANNRVQLALPAVAPGASGGLPLVDSTGGVLLRNGAIDLANMTPQLKTLLIRANIVVGGTTTGPVTNDQYFTAGLYSTGSAFIPYYQSTSLGTPCYMWSDGTSWYITTTTPGVSLPGGYFKTASGATALGPYTAQGSAVGVPTITAHGNGVLSSFQPDGITVTANNDKTGYSLTSAEHILIGGTDVWGWGGGGGRTLTAFSFLPSTYTLSSNDEQALSSLRGSYVTPGGIVFSAAALANGPSGGGGDPWATTLPGAYPAGSAGYILGTNLNATISSRMATFGLPTNFANMLIDGSGKVALQAAEHTAIQTDAATGILNSTINGHTFKDLLTILGFSSAGTITSITKSGASPWTITLVYTDGAATATYVSTFSDNTFTVQTGRPTVTFTGLP